MMEQTEQTPVERDDIPERIWIQVYGDSDPEIDTGPINWGEVSWCRDMVFDHDVEYVRADILSDTAEKLRVAEARSRRLEPALRSLLDKLDEVHADSKYQGVWAVSQLHVGQYDGPTYDKELDDARKALNTINEIGGGTEAWELMEIDDE